MAVKPSQEHTQYYSSDEKNLVREKYDLPLVEAVANKKKNGRVRYFGLPGVDALGLTLLGPSL